MGAFLALVILSGAKDLPGLPGRSFERLPAAISGRGDILTAGRAPLHCAAAGLPPAGPGSVLPPVSSVERISATGAWVR